MGFGERLQHAWNAFLSNDKPMQISPFQLSGGYNYRPDQLRFHPGTERSIVTAVFTRIAIDAAAIKVQHVRLDQNGRYLEVINDKLNQCLTVSANVDQTGRALIQDIVMSLCDVGIAAIVPTDTTLNPMSSNAFEVDELRVGEITQWFPNHIQVRVYNERNGMKEEVILPKSMVAIVENPLYAIMNSPNSTLKRLIRKLAILDAIDEQSGAGKLDLIIQLPYTIHSEKKRQIAEQRRKDIEVQLAGSKYGIAYTEATEHITQLNRPAENNLMNQIEYLTKMLYSQLGITEEVMNGTADEAAMLNYHNRTIEPMLSAITEEMYRKFLSKTARSQGQSISFFRDPFKLVPTNNIADIADKFTRNEILSSNEVRAIIGYKPVDDPRADELRNKNLNQEKNGDTPPMTTDENEDAEHSEMEHHGIKGQKWGVRNGPPYPLNSSKKSKDSSNKSERIIKAKTIANKIRKRTVELANGGPAGNQNCELCTWTTELQFRGRDVLPRAVYSPRDIIFTKNGYDIVKNPTKIHINSKSDVLDKVSSAPDGARFYTHVKWDEGVGGHEFVLMNDSGSVVLIDSQQGLVCSSSDKKAKSYFDEVDYSESFIVRMDDKPINENSLKLNSNKYRTDWDTEKDIAYMREHGMIEDDDKVNHMATEEDEDELEHHGIKGQKWGLRKGPPYPLGFKKEKFLTDCREIISKLNDSDYDDFVPPKNIYYGKIKYDNHKPVGFVLAENKNDSVDISVATLPSFRGKGIATSLAKEALEVAQNDSGISNIYWAFTKGNEGSKALASNLGFDYSRTTNNGYEIWMIKK